jgi:hypothetical protein
MPFIGLIDFLLAIAATVKCGRTGQRVRATIFWLALIWLVPLIGPIVALAFMRPPQFNPPPAVRAD